MQPLDAARVIFAASRVCGAASVENIQGVDVPEGEVRRLTKRYSLALNRLLDSEALTNRRAEICDGAQAAAKSRDDLEDWAEQILDAIVRPAAADSGEGTASAKSALRPPKAASREFSQPDEGSSSKPEQDL